MGGGQSKKVKKYQGIAIPPPTLGEAIAAQKAAAVATAAANTNAASNYANNTAAQSNPSSTASTPPFSSPSSTASSSPVQPNRSPLLIGEEAELNRAEGTEFQPIEPPNTPAATVANQAVAIGFWEKDKTFRPQRALPPQLTLTKRGAKAMRTMDKSLRAATAGNALEEAVKLPDGEDLQDWLAIHTVHFFNAVSLIYGTISSCCTSQSCPIMAAGKYEYRWMDTSPQYSIPTRLPAPEYISLMMTEIDDQISDSDIFPLTESNYPPDFMKIVKNMFKKLFRLYAHIYCSHHDRIRAIGAAAHLNTAFKHFLLFVFRFELVPANEMKPLEKLIARLTIPAAVIRYEPGSPVDEFLNHPTKQSEGFATKAAEEEEEKTTEM